MLSCLSEERRGRMQCDRRTLNKRLVTLLGIFAGRIAEKAGAESLADFNGVAPARDYAMLVALEDGDELLSDVFDAAHVAGLNEILEAPGSREFRLFPGVVDVEEGKVVAAWVMKFGFLLISLILLVSWPVEY